MNTRPLGNVATPALVSAEQVGAGKLIPPLSRLRIMEAGEWQDFTLEYAHSLKDIYRSVESHAGAGDQGCDVVGQVDDQPGGLWDNYQCKHYAAALTPGDIWVELGKLCYYTWKGAYPYPRAYYFIAPRGAGAKLSKLLRDPVKLKSGLLANWNDYCRDDIVTTPVPLDASLRAHIGKLDFSIFSAPSPLVVIEQHRKTAWHVARFGGGLPPRPKPAPPPAEVGTGESVYVRCLLDAYEEKLNAALASIADLKDMDLTSHLKRAREEFYSAESLREFSRDSVPAGTFEALLDEVYSGVIDVVQATHPNAMERVLATVKQAKMLAFTANALVSRVTNVDKGGMCHHLANDGRVKWKK